jgi:hypothetical protein
VRFWWSNWLNEETRLVLFWSSWWCNWEYNLVVVVVLEVEGMKLGFGSCWKLRVTGKWEVQFENDIVVWNRSSDLWLKVESSQQRRKARIWRREECFKSDIPHVWYSRQILYMSKNLGVWNKSLFIYSNNFYNMCRTSILKENSI